MFLQLFREMLLQYGIHHIFISICCISLLWIYCQNILNIENKYCTHVKAILTFLYNIITLCLKYAICRYLGCWIDHCLGLMMTTFLF